MSNREISCRLHPFAPPVAQVEGIEVRVAQEASHIVLRYRLDGDLQNLKIPAPAIACRADRLWEHTCFEAFIRAGGSSAYYEFNFSPSGQWAAYAFRAYRDAAADENPVRQPAILVEQDRGRLEMAARIPTDAVPGLAAPTSLFIGLSAVLEASDGTLSYWALKHPTGKPDFHHPESFALEFALQRRSA